MNLAQKFPSRIFASALKLTAACLVVFFSWSSLSAHETCSQCIQTTSKQIRCIADEIKCDVKSSLKGEKGYVKIVATNARIRVKAAAICRRIERNCDYRGLCRDVNKLNELACDLKLNFDQSIAYLNQCKQCPVTGCHCQVANEINTLIELARGLDAILTGESFSHVPGSNVIFEYPAFPNADPAVAPSPVLEPPMTVAPGPPQTQVRKPSTGTQSVLDR
jgi:hypothetical protein